MLVADAHTHARFSFSLSVSLMDRSRVIQKYHHPVLAVAFLSVTVLVTFILTYLVYDDNTRSICESLKYDCDDATTSDIPTISFTFVPESNWVIRLVVGEYTATTSYYFLLLPVAPSVSCSCIDALGTLNTRRRKLPLSPAVSHFTQLV